MCMNMKDRKTNCQSRGAQGECQSYTYRTRWNMKNECARTCCEREELYKRPRRS